MTGDTDDISTIASNGLYDCIKFYDPVGNSFPDDKHGLGPYLGPALVIGPYLTAQIFNMNVEVVHQSTYRSPTAQELNDKEVSRRNFDKKIEDKLGPKVTVKDSDDMNMDKTPMFKCMAIMTV